MKAREAKEKYPVVDDYWYELSDEQLRHGLSMTPLQRLQWLDEARRFTLLARRALVRRAKLARRIKRR